jgi:hypothetical protein
MLLQYPDDLLSRVPVLLHRPSSQLDYEKTPVLTGRVFREQVKTLAHLSVDIHIYGIDELG